MSTVGRTGINAWGDHVRPRKCRQWPVNQESPGFIRGECQREPESTIMEGQIEIEMEGEKCSG